MLTYGERHFSAEQTLGGLFASLGQDTGDLPPFVEAQLLFPYLTGQRFVERLYATGNDSWSVVNTADRFRPPASTEQVLHPEKYLAVEQPERVASRPSRGDAGGGLAAHRERDLGRVGDRRAARATRARPRAGEATATSSGSSPPAPARHRAASATRSSCAGAGTRAATPASSRPRCATGCRGSRARARSPRRGSEVTLALAPDAALAQRLARG